MPPANDNDLGLELIELAHALTSGRILADLERSGAYGSAAEVRQAMRSIAATIDLIAARLRTLGNAMAGGLTGGAPRGRPRRGGGPGGGAA